MRILRGQLLYRAGPVGRAVTVCGLVCLGIANAHLPVGKVFPAFEFPQAASPVVDGDLSDWAGVDETFVIDTAQFVDLVDDTEVDEEDFSVRMWVGWNDAENRLYVAARVLDDVEQALGGGKSGKSGKSGGGNTSGGRMLQATKPPTFSGNPAKGANGKSKFCVNIEKKAPQCSKASPVKPHKGQVKCGPCDQKSKASRKCWLECAQQSFFHAHCSDTNSIENQVHHIKDFNFYLQYRNPAFSKFELGFKYTFIVLAVLTLAIFWSSLTFFSTFFAF